MYCPKCSQQQISDAVRFCSRCGFQLGVVAELLETDGVLQNYYPSPPEKLSIYRQITSGIGAKMIFFSIVFVPFAVLLGIPFDTAAFLLISAFLFFAGFMQILYTQIFGKKTFSPENRLHKLNSAAAYSQITPPAADTAPILEIKTRDTNEILPPPSVTDPTTRLLAKEASEADAKS